VLKKRKKFKCTSALKNQNYGIEQLSEEVFR
jgi:hypothetical protein